MQTEIITEQNIGADKAIPYLCPPPPENHP